MKEKLLAFGPIGAIVVVLLLAVIITNQVTGWGPGGENSESVKSSNASTSETDDSGTSTDGTDAGVGTEDGSGSAEVQVGGEEPAQEVPAQEVPVDDSGALGDPGDPTDLSDQVDLNVPVTDPNQG